MSQHEPTIVHVTDTDAVFTNVRRSASRVAKVLGRERRGDQEFVYLDRLIHGHDEGLADGWKASGAISTILTRPLA